MRAPNIYRTDEVLLWLGGIFTVMGALAALGRASHGVWPEPSLLFFAAGGPVLLAVGWRIRRAERRAQAVWRMLSHAGEASFADLQASTGLSAPEVEAAVRALNDHGHGAWVVDARARGVVDARLRSSVVAAADCPACGARSMRSVALSGLADARCEHCGAPLPVETLNRLKQEAIERLRRPDPPAAAPLLAGPQGRFRPLLALLLLVVFWPLGLAYIIWYRARGRR